MRSSAASKSCSENSVPSFSTASSETVLLMAFLLRGRMNNRDWLSHEHRLHRRRGKGAKDDRTISGLDGLQYALKYVVNVHK
jgi:hypothetical protein